MTTLSRDIMRHSRELRVFRPISLTGTAGTQWRDDAIAARCTVSGYAFCAEPLPPDRAQAQGSPAARLVWDKGQVLLFPGRNVIGREADAAVRVDDRTISRHHAAIVIGGKTATVEDLDSKNGTFVNGQRVTSPVALRDGAVLEVGSVRMVFREFSALSTTTLYRT
jgi:hypothetical protein